MKVRARGRRPRRATATTNPYPPEEGWGLLDSDTIIAGLERLRTEFPGSGWWAVQGHKTPAELDALLGPDRMLVAEIVFPRS